MEFYKSIAKYYNYIFPFNPKQTEFISQRIVVDSESTKIIELGCAVGTLLVELAKYYSNVYGIDLDEDMISIAKTLDYQNNTNIVAGNMLDFSDAFKITNYDGVLCLGNTLVHLHDETQIEKLVFNCYNNLKVGAKFLIQIINYDRILDQGIKELATIENDTIKFVREYDYLKNENRINFITELTIKEENKTLKNTQLLLPLRQAKLVHMLEDAGFNEIITYGDFNGNLLTEQSVPLIIEAIK